MTTRNIQELIGLMQKNLECSICLELFTNPVSTKCDHCFCRFCITEFLEKKRSVPCPLCKQPVTKRSLQEREELANIVNAIRKLITAFQDDSGTIYSPPKGPQSFFPCTPDTVISKPEISKSKLRRNLRCTKQATGAAAEDPLGLFTDEDKGDGDVSITSSTATPTELRPRKKPAPPAESVSNTSRTIASGSRNRTRSTVTTPMTTEGLLQYLNEGSCGYNGGSSPPNSRLVGQDPAPHAENRPAQTGDSAGVAIFVEDADTENPDLETLEGNNRHNKSVSAIPAKSQQNTRRGAVERDKGNQVESLEKENLVEHVSSRALKKKGEGPAKSGLAEGSQNSSDMSISSTQQFLQPRPVITRTYGRHASTRGSSDLKVKNWIASLPANPQTHATNAENSVSVKGAGNEENQSVRRTVEEEALTDQPQEQNENSPVTDLRIEDQAPEVMLTPPVRKRRIFKSREPLEEQDKSNSQDDEPADPYVFVVGHTPVAKSKKGRSRSKENKGKTVTKPQLKLDLAEKKTVRFSDNVTNKPKKVSVPAAADSGMKEKRADKNDESVEEFLTSADDVHPTETAAEHSGAEATHSEAGMDDTSAGADQKRKTSARKKRQVRKDTAPKVTHGEASQIQREKKTEELAAWIGQAEDHDLLFSTQDAHASIESMEAGEERPEDKNLQPNQNPTGEPRKEIEIAPEKQVTTPAHPPVSISAHDFKSPSPVVHSNNSRTVEVVAETQLSNEGDIILPSPASATGFPSFSTPKTRTTRQTRSSLRGHHDETALGSSSNANKSRPREWTAEPRQSPRVVKNAGNGDSADSALACGSPRPRLSLKSKQTRSDKPTPCASQEEQATESCSHVQKSSSYQSQGQESTSRRQGADTIVSPCTPVDVASPKNNRRSSLHQKKASPQVIDQSSAQEESGESSMPTSCVPETESISSEPVPGRSPPQKRRSLRRRNVTADEAEKSKPRHPPKPAAPDNISAEEKPRKTGSDEREQIKATPDTDYNTHGDDGASLEIIAPTLEEEEGNLDFDASGSSATDDLNITPALTDFEPPNLSLQPEEIQNRLSSPSLPSETRIASAPSSQQSSTSYKTSTTTRGDNSSATLQKKSTSKEDDREENTVSDTADDDVRIVQEEGVTRKESMLKDTAGLGSSLPVTAETETLTDGTVMEDSSATLAPESVDVVAASESTQPSSASQRSLRHKVTREAHRLQKLAKRSPPAFQEQADNLISRSNNGSQSLSRSSSTSGSPSQSLLNPFPARQKRKGKAKFADVDTHPKTSDGNKINIRSGKANQQASLSTSDEIHAGGHNKANTKPLPGQEEQETLEPESLPLFGENQDLDKEGGFIRDENEDAKEDTDRGCEDQSKLLVVDTQHRTQSESLRSPTLPSSCRVVMDSLQDDILDKSQGHPTLVSGHQYANESSEVEKEQAMDTSITPRKLMSSSAGKETTAVSSHLNAPLTSLSGQEIEITNHEQARSPQITEKPQKRMEDTPSLKSRKRKSAEETDEFCQVKKSPRLCPPRTPILKSGVSPASSSGKSVCSAPPRATSLMSDSDEDDAVLVVRRTKRKCFSLDGSPLRSKTPAKRPRSRLLTRTVNNGSDVDLQGKDGGSQHVGIEVMVGEGQDRAVLDGRVRDVIVDTTEENDEEVRRGVGKKPASQGCRSHLADEEKCMVEENGNSSHQNDDIQVVTPVRKARKIKRGLASSIGRDILQPGGETASSAVEQNLIQLSPSIADKIHKQTTEAADVVDLCHEEAGDVEDKNSTTADPASGDPANHLKLKGKGTHREASGSAVEVLNADEPDLNRVRTLGRESGTADGTDTDGTLAPSRLPSQSKLSLVSQDKSLEITHASVRTETDDATIPPVDFDLRFDSEVEEEDAGSVGPGTNTEDDEGVDVNSGEAAEAEEQMQEKRRSLTPQPSPQKQTDPTSCAVETGNTMSAAAEVVEDDSEEEVAVKKKKPKRPVIDSDTESSQNSGDESEASFQLNFTSSSAVSSQSEILTTQQRTVMEGELERMRAEIAEMEAKLHQRSSKADSGNDSCSRTEKSSGNKCSLKTDADDDGDRQTPSCVAEADSSSAVSNPKTEMLGSAEASDGDDEKDKATKDEGGTDADVNMEDNATVYNDDDICVSLPARQASRHSSPICTPTKQKENGASSDEDSDDLFLSPLSPTPPPAAKHTLARRDSKWEPLFPIDLDAIDTRPASPVTRVRQSLDFTVRDSKSSDAIQSSKVSHSQLKKYDDLSDSQDSDSLAGVKKVPDSQFTDSDDSDSVPHSPQNKRSSQRLSKKTRTQEDGTSGSVCVVDSSGSPAPGPPRRSTQSKRVCLRQLAGANECKVYSKFNDHVTHVIIKTAPGSRVCERTLKYFQGVAGRCWVLSYDWVTDSTEAGRPLPEAGYEVVGDTVKGDDHKGPKKARLSSAPLLAGFAFTCVGVSPDMTKKEVIQLLTMSGAEVLDDPWELNSHRAKYKLVIRCVDSDAQPPTPAEIELFNGQYKHFGLVTVAREWILDSICTHSLQPLADYVFNTNKDLRLPL
ncbi:hypothetical protein BaRGS_00029590 [Batillaria attramentaria]|uniref:RING-type E3 ubiquitin transferase BRCA1 n=1 Tax=Batillaria attramentaria TaxID=370345 RepID=A0ABD0JVN8_9CAEN